MTLSITIGWPHADLSPNSRAHHMAKWRASKAAKEEAEWATRAANGRGHFEASDKIDVHLTANPPKEWRTGDDDNLIARCKSHLDGIAKGLGINDRQFSVTGVTWGERADRPVITVTLTRQLHPETDGRAVG